MPPRNEIYRLLKANPHRYSPTEIAALLALTDEARVHALAASVTDYLNVNLPAALDRRSGLGGYRTNPYVLTSSASLLKLMDAQAFARFLFDTKFYMGLETSFGKQMEAAFVGQYPIGAAADQRWCDPPEKAAESAALAGLSNEEKARRRNVSVWREVDRSCVVGDRRYLVTIKSGPHCINDSQVAAMKDAISTHHAAWLRDTQRTYRGVRELDVIIGITYGTDRTTNNKENQILVKLMEHGFVEEDRIRKPGILIDTATRAVRVYRRIGQDFWATIGDPAANNTAGFVFLEILLALTRALAALDRRSLEDKVNARILDLSGALRALMFPRESLPGWVRHDFEEHELFWLATAMTAFFDEGI